MNGNRTLVMHCNSFQRCRCEADLPVRIVTRQWIPFDVSVLQRRTFISASATTSKCQIAGSLCVRCTGEWETPVSELVQENVTIMALIEFCKLHRARVVLFIHNLSVTLKDGRSHSTVDCFIACPSDINVIDAYGFRAVVASPI